MEQVEEICDHIILVNKGKKILDGTVAGVKQQFKEHLFTVGSDQSLDETASPGLFEVISAEENTMKIKIAPGTDTNHVLRSFMDRGIMINQFNELLPSLNDIFIKLVEGTATARQFQKIQ